MGLEDRLRRLERRLQPQPAPPPPTLIDPQTSRAIDAFLTALTAHRQELANEAAIWREHGEDAKNALALAKLAVLERHEDGRAALDLAEPLNAGIRERRKRLRGER
jgi:hypothetical protein